MFHFHSPRRACGVLAVLLALAMSLALLQPAPAAAQAPLPEAELWAQIEAAHNRGEPDVERALAEKLPEPARSQFLQGLENQSKAAQPTGGGPFIGINGAACAYSDFTSAMTAASSGDTLYIAPISYLGRIGTITKNLTFQPASYDCTTYAGSGVTIDGNDAIISYGGVAEISNGATVTFRNLVLTNGTATWGGILYAGNGATVNLDNTTLTLGSATQYGGGLRLYTGASSTFTTGSLIWGCQTTGTGAGGGAAINNGNLNLYGSSRVGWVGNRNYSISNGGGVYMNGGTLNLYENSKIAGNEAEEDGGGVYATNGAQVNLYNASSIGYSTLPKEGEKVPTFDNIAFNGGGIYLDGAGTFLHLVDDTGIYNNAASNAGGGIYAINSAGFDISSASINGNFAADRGGAIMILDNIHATIQNESWLSYNWSNNFGGAIYISGDNSWMNIYNSNLYYNSSTYYGAIRLNAYSTLNLSGADLQHNSAEYGDGGALGLGTGTATIVTSVIQNNDAATNGGAIFHNGGFLQITDCDIRYNDAGANGGGIYTNDGMVYVWAVNQDSYLAVNTAVNGAGVYATGNDLIYFRAVDDGQLRLNTNIALTGSGGGIYATGTIMTDIYGDVQMTSNTAHDNGGAIYQHGGSLIVDDHFRTHIPHILVNTAYYGNGGGMYIQDAASVLLYGIQLGDYTGNGNDAPEGYGGGIYLSGGLDKSAYLYNILAMYNESGKSGGAIAVEGGLSAHIQSSFSASKDQKDPDRKGGASSYCNPTSLFPDRYCSEFRFNSAGVDDTGYGGAIYVNNNSGAFINQTSFHGNTADWGGAIEVLYGIAGAKNSLFTTNDGGTNDSAVHAYYAASTGHAGRFNCELCTFVDNPSRPIYYVPGSSGGLTKSIIWNNSGELYYTTGDPDTLFFCDDYDEEVLPGSMNISQDPRFITTPRGSYRLGPDSPAINACTTGSGPDLDGVARPIGGVDRYDMGAFEMPVRVYLPQIMR